MNPDYKAAVEAWSVDQIQQAEWERMTKSPVFQNAIRLVRLKLEHDVTSADKGLHSQVADRLLYATQAGNKALNLLSSLADEKPAPPKPLPPPWSCYADPTPQTPTA